MTGLSQSACRARWETRLAEYQRLVAVEKSLSDDSGKDANGRWLCDLAVDAWSDALDVLIEDTPAPGVSEVTFKLRAALVRGEPFEGGIFDKDRDAILADLDRLAAGEAMPPPTMPAWESYSEAARAVAAGESDPTMTPQQRADRALDCHRAWRRWMEAMDRATGATARLAVLSGGREAA